MNNFYTRALWGAVYVIVIIGMILAGYYAFFILIGLINLVCLLEFAQMQQDTDTAPDRVTVGVCGSLFFLLFHSYLAFDITGLALSSPVLLIPFITELFSKRDKPFQRASMAVAGIIYITVPLSLFVWLVSSVNSDYNSGLAIGYFILLWSSDTFAYLTGKAIGKTPLFPRVSPKKTWEGSIGGLICSLGISIILFYTIGSLTLISWIALALIIFVFGTLGDLIESMLKRSLNIKDSGRFLPGHGGALDRFDSLLFSLPFAALWFYLFT